MWKQFIVRLKPVTPCTTELHAQTKPPCTTELHAQTKPLPANCLTLSSYKTNLSLSLSLNVR